MKRLWTITKLIITDDMMNFVALLACYHGIRLTDDVIFYLLGGFALGATLRNVYKRYKAEAL